MDDTRLSKPCCPYCGYRTEKWTFDYFFCWNCDSVFSLGQILQAGAPVERYGFYTHRAKIMEQAKGV